MTLLESAVDAALEACVIPDFSRIGQAVRSRLPEFTEDIPPAAGKVVLITGATSGIGYAAAVALARQGAAVHFLARDRSRAERAQRGIAAASGSTNVGYGLANLEDLDAVRAFAAGSALPMTGSTCSSTTRAPSTPSSARTRPGPS